VLIKEKNLFPHFGGWQGGYGAFTYHIAAAHNLVEYVKNQEKHHHIKTYEEEYKELLEEHQVRFDEKYML
jgi:putative transposase